MIQQIEHALQYVNIDFRSKNCWHCLEPMTGMVSGAYRYHSECWFKMMNKEDKVGKRSKPR